jgi:hypothetical protein
MRSAALIEPETKTKMRIQVVKIAVFKRIGLEIRIGQPFYSQASEYAVAWPCTDSS